MPGITGDVDRNAFFGSEREFAAWREGRFDIGARKWRGGEPKVQVAGPRTLPTPPARIANSSSDGPRPPGRVPSRTVQASD